MDSLWVKHSPLTPDPLTRIEKVIGQKMLDSGKIIKDYATAKGVESSTIKEPLQKLVDSTK